MMEYLFFAAKMIMVSGVLYGYYHLFLRDRPFHRYNRVFLLLAGILSILIPFLKISLPLGDSDLTGMPFSGTLRVITGEWWELSSEAPHVAIEKASWFSPARTIWLLYAAGAIICVAGFVRALLYIFRIRKQYRYQRIGGGVRLYDTSEKAAPFSFFHSIFWHQGIAFDSKEGQQIFRHELFHVQQRHSADILWMEICCTLAWFNPFFHLIKKELRTIHEFLADEFAISKNDPLGYAELLLQQSIDRASAGGSVSSLTSRWMGGGNRNAGRVILQDGSAGLGSPMFHATVRRRIAMITGAAAGHYGPLARIMILPIAGLLFCALALRVTPAAAADGLRAAVEPLTIVVDAGHGGIDPGAKGEDGAEDEKVLALRLAKAIKSMEADYHVHIVLTRDADILPGNAADKQQGLENRVTMTKEAGAKVFVSLHVNNTGQPGPTTESGFVAFVSKRRSFIGSDKLAAAILGRTAALYTTSATVLRRDEGIYVLDHNDCSAVILECGYINNKKDLAFLKDSQDAIAKAILQGIVDYQSAQ